MPERHIDAKSKKLLLETFIGMKRNDVPDLLMSLMSSSEIKDLSRRIMCAKLLKEDHTYSDVALKMGMSEGTINKIHFKTKGSPIINKLFGKE